MADEWITERAKRLRRAVGGHGAIMAVQEAKDLIAARTATVSENMGISVQAARIYLTDDVIESMALSITGTGPSFTPAGVGESLYDRPRTCLVSQVLVGRMIAGLAESIKAHTLDGDGAWAQVSDAAEMLSLLGLILADQHTAAPTIAAPPDLLGLVADQLDAAADAADNRPDAQDLARTLRTDAKKIRASITTLPGPR